MLLLVFSNSQGVPQPGYANLSLSASDVWNPLNASGATDSFYWTDADIFRFFEEAASRLERLGIFVVRDASLSTAPEQGDYTSPADHVATLQVDVGARTLRPRTVREVEALDSDWPATEGAVKSFLEDREGVDLLTLYPKPTAIAGEEPIGIFMQTCIPEISSTSAFVPVPDVMRDYFTFSAIRQASMKDTPASKEEIADWLKSITDAYEQRASSLWGH